MLCKKLPLVLALGAILTFSPLSQAMEDEDAARIGALVDTMPPSEFNAKLHSFVEAASESDTDALRDVAARVLDPQHTIEDQQLLFNMYANATKFQAVTMATMDVTSALSKMNTGDDASRDFKVSFLYLLEVEQKEKAAAVERARKKAAEAATQ
ncbi:hypothetical protein [Candidatus Albibeggiatoa sp. nov. NOAA]|uniref:hypothetical protein n=1 Tax=Candidatus Albibeggiatoa sp. nov. NOAA TaxID=3162724 RepID=UPI0032FAFD88|nr:hypothetical protein [Thiotrichaceae bacterium]